MHLRIFAPLFLLVVAIAALLIPGCDKLTTDVNNSVVIDTTLGQACLDACHGSDVVDKNINVPRGQWITSAHASAGLIEYRVQMGDSSFVTNRCGPVCHTSQGYINFVNTGRTTDPQLAPAVINCATCHLYHSGGYGNWDADTLRGSRASTPLALGNEYVAGKSNMCVVCHRTPELKAGLFTDSLKLSASFGPHSSAQGDLLYGQAGFRFRMATTVISHDSTSAKNGCVHCHYGPTSEGGTGYETGGHTFHLDLPDFAKNDTIGLNTWCDSLAVLLVTRGVLDPTDLDLAAFQSDSSIPKDAARVLYNYLLYKRDRSKGIHNGKFMIALMKESIRMMDSIPLADFTADNLTGCKPLVVQFTDASTGQRTSFDWSFGDGLAESQQSPQHTYDTAGVYTVALAISGEYGAESIKKVGYITVLTTPKILFQLVYTSGAAPVTVNFTSVVTNADSLRWDFGDGGTSPEPITSYTYLTAGTYTVKLFAYNQCGVDSLVKQDTVVVAP